MEATFLDQVLFDIYEILYDYLFYASIAFVLFYGILKRPLWFRKVQKKMPKLTDYSRDIMFSILSVAIFAVINTATFWYAFDYTKVYMDFSEYGVGYYIFTWVWMFLLHDTWFYWWHRAMHHPLLFKHVHLVHHKSTNPSPWTAYAFHPFEAVIEASILPVIAFTLPVHSSAISFFFLFQIAYNVYEHLGFELYPNGFNKTWFGRFISTSVSHNLHHHKFHGNFGLYFLFWDRLMGTLREDYDETFEKTTSGKPDFSFNKSKKINQARQIEK